MDTQNTVNALVNETVKDEPFIWEELNIEHILQDHTYAALFEADDERGDKLHHDYEAISTIEERKAVYEAYATERQMLLGPVLASPKMEAEYKYFSKFKRYEAFEKHVDPYIRELLKRFISLPFTLSMHSCSGHIVRGTNRLEEGDLMLMGFVADRTFSEDEKSVQESFFNHFDEWNRALQLRTGSQDIRLFIEAERYLGDDEWEDIPVEVAIAEREHIYIHLDVIDEDWGRNRGGQLLQMVWEEFWLYLDKLQGKKMPMPEIDPQDLEVDRQVATIRSFC